MTQRLRERERLFCRRRCSTWECFHGRLVFVVRERLLLDVPGLTVLKTGLLYPEPDGARVYSMASADEPTAETVATPSAGTTMATAVLAPSTEASALPAAGTKAAADVLRAVALTDAVPSA